MPTTTNRIDRELPWRGSSERVWIHRSLEFPSALMKQKEEKCLHRVDKHTSSTEEDRDSCQGSNPLRCTITKGKDGENGHA
jgi:hypothetical protein